MMPSHWTSSYRTLVSWNLMLGNTEWSVTRIFRIKNWPRNRDTHAPAAVSPLLHYLAVLLSQSSGAVLYVPGEGEKTNRSCRQSTCVSCFFFQMSWWGVTHITCHQNITCSLCQLQPMYTANVERRIKVVTNRGSVTTRPPAPILPSYLYKKMVTDKKVVIIPREHRLPQLINQTECWLCLIIRGSVKIILIPAYFERAISAACLLSDKRKYTIVQLYQ